MMLKLPSKMPVYAEKKRDARILLKYAKNAAIPHSHKTDMANLRGVNHLRRLWRG